MKEERRVRVYVTVFPRITLNPSPLESVKEFGFEFYDTINHNYSANDQMKHRFKMIENIGRSLEMRIVKQLGMSDILYNHWKETGMLGVDRQ